MWRIEGGVTVGFENLGQTWSPPQVVDVLIDVAGVPTSTTAVIFGGGHDDSLDKDFQTSNIGNIVYVVDALTGALLTSIGGTGTTAKLTVPGMDYPINTPLSLRDFNGDGNFERLYFGDEGGNIWRIDLKIFNATSTAGAIATVGQLADIAVSAGATPGPLDDPLDLDDNVERRRFFASTAAIPVRDTLFSNESNYEYVLVQSGDRPDPLNQVIQNAFYAFRDFRLEPLPDADNNGIADVADSPDADGWPNTPLSRAELFDVTDNPFQTAPDGTPVDAANFDEQTAGSAINGLKAASGWFIDYKELNGTYIGEKGLTRPNVFFGNLFYTTYIPEVTDQLQQQCQVSAGFSRLYGLNLLTGAALFADWDNPGSGQTPTTSTRAKTLGGGGIASDPLIIISEGGTGGLAGSGAGGESFPTGATLPIQRTYWFQQ
jgi:type IV pilus assembly protein PilY1